MNDFVIIGNAWEAGRENPICHHRVAMELVRRGHKVLWIEGAGMRIPNLCSGRDCKRILRKIASFFRGARFAETPPDSLCVCSPLFIPLPEYAWIRRWNGWICRQYIRRCGRRMGLRDPVLINAVPVLAEAMRGWGRETTDHRPQTTDQSVVYGLSPNDSVAGQKPPHLGPLPQGERRCQGRSFCDDQKVMPLECHSAAQLPLPSRERAGVRVSSTESFRLRSKVSSRAPRVVYYCIDQWDAYPGYDPRVMAETDKRCCELADGVLASSGVLAERCRRFSNNVHLLPHGVDHAFFSQALRDPPRPGDLPAGRIAGFFGSLSAWLDQDLLLDLARCVPECQVVLIGRADVSLDRLRGVSNIHLLGPRPFSSLPGYLAHFDVGLIPYRVNDFTMAVNPTKLREMLAGGCPVVATDLPEVRPYAGRGAVVCGSVESFAAAVAERIRNPLSWEERDTISRGVAGETWEARVEEMLRWVGDATPDPIESR